LNAVLLWDSTTSVQIIPIEDPASSTVVIFTNQVIGITADAFEKFLVMTKSDTDVYSLDIYEELDGSPTPTAQPIISAAEEPAANPCLTLDRLNRRALYIGQHHAVKTFVFTSEIDSLIDYKHNTVWQNCEKALKIFNPDDIDPIPIFLRAAADTLIYRYPSGTYALALARAGSIFKVLHADNNYVLYENSSTGESLTGYVSNRSVVPAAGDAYSTPEFLEARVLYNYSIIYKYPTASHELQLLTLRKNFEYPYQLGGLKLFNKVKQPDYRGSLFYEIRLNQDDDGTYFPAETGTFVGYINEKNVMDYNLPPSANVLNSNASIRIPETLGSTTIPVYIRANTNKFEFQNETLANKQRIRDTNEIYKDFTDGKEYARVQYFDDVLGFVRDGWIETSFIIPDSLSAIQIIAIVVLTLLIFVGAVFVVVRVRRRE